LAFYLHPQYRGRGIHDDQFKRIQLTSRRIWKNLGHKKTSVAELDSQLHAYFSNSPPYTESYSPQKDNPLNWWNSIIDGRSSLS